MNFSGTLDTVIALIFIFFLERGPIGPAHLSTIMEHVGHHPQGKLTEILPAPMRMVGRLLAP